MCSILTNLLIGGNIVLSIAILTVCSITLAGQDDNDGIFRKIAQSLDEHFDIGDVDMFIDLSHVPSKPSEFFSDPDVGGIGAEFLPCLL